ncbi:hypothetical protein BDV96DRAFT_644631 [Lophiotrema nucula]|uniref:Uncharacterized protein n=1 Tax=Lophiotrema nucula TaxID=690887 RepID=A0A6A5ZCG1_9PLEO|nr:hypothetical protein BDV96DRAFT_644631 [Lophiotrema nucula]
MTSSRAGSGGAPPWVSSPTFSEVNTMPITGLRAPWSNLHEQYLDGEDRETAHQLVGSSNVIPHMPEAYGEDLSALGTISVNGIGRQRQTPLTPVHDNSPKSNNQPNALSQLQGHDHLEDNSWQYRKSLPPPIASTFIQGFVARADPFRLTNIPVELFSTDRATAHTPNSPVNTVQYPAERSSVLHGSGNVAVNTLKRGRADSPEPEEKAPKQSRTEGYHLEKTAPTAKVVPEEENSKIHETGFDTDIQPDESSRGISVSTSKTSDGAKHPVGFHPVNTSDAGLDCDDKRVDRTTKGYQDFRVKPYMVTNALRKPSMYFPRGGIFRSRRYVPVWDQNAKMDSDNFPGPYGLECRKHGYFVISKSHGRKSSCYRIFTYNKSEPIFRSVTMEAIFPGVKQLDPASCIDISSKMPMEQLAIYEPVGILPTEEVDWLDTCHNKLKGNELENAVNNFKAVDGYRSSPLSSPVVFD